MKSLVVTALLLFFNTAMAKQKDLKPNEVLTDEHYLWLEDIEGEKALDFVKKENKRSIEKLKENPSFNEFSSLSKEIIFDEKRIEPVYLIGGMVFSFWKDKKNPRGIWRKTTKESYATQKPKWEIVLDLDQLAKKEKENWVWGGASELLPDRKLALIYLSRGGKDANIIREFDMVNKKFVTNGFYLPEAKGSAAWVDKNTLLIDTDFGPNTMTTSGYPRQVRKWKRGTDYKNSELVLEVQPTDMSGSASVFIDGSKVHQILTRQIGFFESEIFYLKDNGEKIKIPVSKDVRLVEVFKDNLILQPLKDFGKFKKGSVVALPIKSVLSKKDKAIKDIEIVFTPTDKTFVQSVSSSKDNLVLSLVDNIVPKVDLVSRTEDGKWVKERLLPELKGSVNLQSTDTMDNYLLLSYTDFFVPTTLYGGTFKNKDQKILKTSPTKFNANNMEFNQYFAKSADGTLIPYYLVSKKGLKLDGKNPTVISGYGGFNVSRTPFYSASVGKLWLEKGGVYVLANLRGGGEFGPQWHQQVLKEKRPKVFEDLIAIGEDLIKKKITSSEHLGIMGGSNGGLLVGATMVKRPDLFKAVVCQVPLLDMLRYHKLLAGASWMDEYGDPEDPKMRKAISQYSPFQNVKNDVKYPEIFFMTSTKDDRVHPGHARKMAAKMKDQGHSFLYYENTEGGHKGNANQDQEVLWQALMWTYLSSKLN